jgi:hypothetical protein
VLPRSRFIRLLTLCLMIGLWSPTIVSLVFYYSLSLATLPWGGWSGVHKNFSRIPFLPITTQSPSPHEIQRSFYWMCTASSFVLVAVMASGEDFRSDCRRVWAFLCRKEGSSRRIAVLVCHESHRSTETVLSEIPSTTVASNYDAEKHHSCDTPSMGTSMDA